MTLDKMVSLHRHLLNCHGKQFDWPFPESAVVFVDVEKHDQVWSLVSVTISAGTDTTGEILNYRNWNLIATGDLFRINASQINIGKSSLLDNNQLYILELRGIER